jgi:predicted nucleic acid-binding protein
VSYLVDTNILSEVRKGPRCNPGVSAWFAGVASEEIFLSALTLGELRKGLENIRRRDEPAARALEAWLQDLVATYDCLNPFRD